MKFLMLIIIFLVASLGTAAQAQSVAPMSQYPSPMQEHVRAHQRLAENHYSGNSYTITDLLPKAINIYLPPKITHANNADLLIHFFGNKNIVDYAAEHYHGHLIAVSVNLGSGSSVYERPFKDTALFSKLVDTIRRTVKQKINHRININHIIISGFSAGYGAVRQILATNNNFSKVDAVLLLDGLHASYVPERKVLYEGGHIDSSAYINFLKFCQLAVDNKPKKEFLFTHSEIFPGTFVSTTESADYLLHELSIQPKAVLKSGPGGMQQISDARKNNFRIMGFAGNSAPDHIDHLEGLSYFLNLMMKHAK